jgi:hypothetical protein
MQVYTRVPTIDRPSAVNTALYTTRVPDAAMVVPTSLQRYEEYARVWWGISWRRQASKKIRQLTGSVDEELTRRGGGSGGGGAAT